MHLLGMETPPKPADLADAFAVALALYMRRMDLPSPNNYSRAENVPVDKLTPAQKIWHDAQKKAAHGSNGRIKRM
jgi:crossover junction endodeoxyribonuclease RuvC